MSRYINIYIISDWDEKSRWRNALRSGAQSFFVFFIPYSVDDCAVKTNLTRASMCVCVCSLHVCDIIVSCAVGRKPCAYGTYYVVSTHNGSAQYYVYTPVGCVCVYNMWVCRWPGKEKYYIIIIIYGMYRKRSGPASGPNLYSAGTANPVNLQRYHLHRACISRYTRYFNVFAANDFNVPQRAVPT